MTILNGLEMQALAAREPCGERASLGAHLGIAPTCMALGLRRATYYRRRRPQPIPRPAPPRALSPAKPATVLAMLHAPRFGDLAPAEVYATLLDEGQYLCSERVMYRIAAHHV